MIIGGRRSTELCSTSMLRRLHRSARGSKDKNVLYSAELQHCAANHDVGCGENVLTKAHKAGTYRISGTRWVIDQLKITDPPAARAVFQSVLQAFPANTAD